MSVNPNQDATPPAQDSSSAAPADHSSSAAPADHSSPDSAAVDRRGFISRSAMTVAGIVGSTLAGKGALADVGPQSARDRAQSAYNIREHAAAVNFFAGAPPHADNGDEALYSQRWGNYSKGLQHDQYGQVLPDSYNSLLKALKSGRSSDFEQIKQGGARVQTNPQASLGFDLEGPDSHALYMPPAPALNSAEMAGEIVENYWMGLTRDIPLNQMEAHPMAAAACADLNKLSVFKGPKINGQVTPQTLFRGNLDGDLVGPLFSQFLWQDMPYGSLNFPQNMTCATSTKDYMTTFDNWLAVQNGQFTGKTTLIDQTRYMCVGRDMCQWVHVDALYEAYLNACLILLGGGYPLDPGNPYVTSTTQGGFGTFGGPHILSLVTEVATRALKAVWYQKWSVHRRLRPEAYAGLVHLKAKNIVPGIPLHPDVLNSDVVSGGALWNFNKVNNQQFFNSNEGSYLLPMAFSEGSPTHPSYGSGHATVAGACVTILKAWFDETAPIKKPVVANADGTQLLPYTGPTLTVNGELNKVASNVGVGRNMAGVHWRSDYYYSLLLGEALAIRLLQEQKATYNEPSALSLIKFDGAKVTI